MGRFLLRRGRQAVLTLLGASVFFFVLVYVIPGDPIRALFGFRPPPPEVLADLRHRYGLDEPLWIQYFVYLRNILQGDFGRSFQGQTVQSIIASAAPISLRLMTITALVQVGLGVGSGVLASIRRRSFLGQFVWLSSTVLVAIPVFALAYLAQATFATRFRWLPVFGLHGPWRGYVLPALVLGASSAAYVARMTAIELQTTLRAPFVITARGNGIAWRRIVGVHALRPATGPVVTLVAANLSQFLAALVIVEGIFHVPGLGWQVFEAVRRKDHAVVVGVLVMSTLAIVVISMAADLVSAALDPRIRSD